MDQALADLATFVHKLGVPQHPAAEQPTETRRALVLPVRFTPMKREQDEYQPSGPEAVAVTRDISTAGISFVHTAPVEADYLQLILQPKDAEQIHVIMRVIRRASLDPYFEIGGEFIKRV